MTAPVRWAASVPVLKAGDPLVVAFAGERGGEGPVTLGQANILCWLEGQPVHHAWMRRTLDLPDGITVDDVAGTFAALLARHEGLRTTYAEGPAGRGGTEDAEGPRQRVAAAGEFAVERYTVVPGVWVRGALIKALVDELDGRVAPDPREVALRVAVVTDGDAVLAGVVEYSHLAADLQAVGVLEQEVAEMLADPARREAGGVRHQPLDQARAEREPRMARRIAGALEYWEDTLRRAPQCAYPVARTEGPAGAVYAELRSEAAAGALGHVVARTGLSRTAVVLAAVCALLHRRTGCPDCTLVTLTSNRFGPETADHVGTLVQGVPLRVDADAPGFDELARRARMALLRAARHGFYDARERTRITERVQWERGVRFTPDPVFHSRVTDPARPLGPVSHGEDAGAVPPLDQVSHGEDAGAVPSLDQVRAARCLSTVTWSPRAATEVTVAFNLLQADDMMRLRLHTGHLDRVPHGDLEAMLLAVERLLVEAACGDLSSEATTAALGVAPVPRGDGWLQVGPCWVETAEVRRLLDDTLAPARLSDAGGRLVAYLVAGPGVATPAQAHARCLAALPGRPTAVTPAHYVLCDRAPDDPADLRGWWRRPVVAEGSGRT
ncbi:condensation domain-containing protein [Sphaerisporangium aureirubrum]|uniref:Condensation domain-containing protein n=1 Tax=Sphaerisporangium aureirubrum TaxID=1544736 RepID=A0ABW1N9J6_9ACTN